LGDRLAVGEDENRDCEEKLNGLEDIDAMACEAAIDPEDCYELEMCFFAKRRRQRGNPAEGQ
jgi:hypothetical protein